MILTKKFNIVQIKSGLLSNLASALYFYKKLKK